MAEARTRISVCLRAGLVLGAATLLAACEALSPAECATADWRQIGTKDGSLGMVDRAADYYESCAKAGLPVDVASYRTGRDAGLQSYCRLDNAINEGLSGRSYGNVCPGQIGLNFSVFHDAGRRVHDARNTLERLRGEQDRMQAELRDPKTSNERKSQLRDQLSRSDRRMDEARNNLRGAEFRLDQVRAELRQRGPY